MKTGLRQNHILKSYAGFSQSSGGFFTKRNAEKVFLSVDATETKKYLDMAAKCRYISAVMKRENEVKITVRIGSELHKKLKESANNKKRSLNAEIEYRLERSFDKSK